MRDVLLHTNMSGDIKANFTYKNLFVVIFSVLAIVFLEGMFLILAADVYTEGKIENVIEGYYLLIIDAILTMIFILLYKPVRDFILYIWDLSVLKKSKTYVYILMGFLVIALSQYIILNLLGFESAEQQRDELGVTTLKEGFFQPIIYLISVAIITPIKEEVLYRGILYRFLESKYNFIIGMFISSVVFGLLHGGFPITAIIMGMVFAILYKKTQSIFPSIVLHILWNLFASILTILFL
ncbi:MULTISPECIES: CPBP family intramembrane glutamic endopeptidase [Bacillus cereus group]|uniref:CPBP family intramembrane glutamic endopeptidase n=1 Tax=Bacillus cereus group TaxID=86661 RepID=UPI001A1B0084|nr:MULTISPECIES: type II CAAX endopeptidase family protein [Bacillus cereus group]MBJ7998199.1 CPBP family intramembrane metalloprotease [Bacillus cereus]MDP1459860.1 type II CAAX endopeptidase family protein [Bacillus wiedmannii]QWH86723.1 CPBP family intramembrane metalloprotease [Bacillus mycoides]QWI98244.1 CPBP family intramembrane metalloprotease [Bacillus mycoides]